MDKKQKNAVATTQPAVSSAIASSTSTLASTNMNAVATAQPTSKVSPSDSNPSPPSGGTASASDSSAATASNQTTSTIMYATPRSSSSCCSHRPCFLLGVQAGLKNCSIKQVVECNNIMPPRRCEVCEDEHLSTSKLSSSSPLSSESKQSNVDISHSANTESSDSDLIRLWTLRFQHKTQAMQKNRAKTFQLCPLRSTVLANTKPL
jgi:hypothetical protein